MKSELVHFAFAALVLVFAGAAELFAPKALGVGFPALLAAVVFVAPRRALGEALVFAAASGLFEEALAGLPAATGLGFFLLVALAGRYATLRAPLWVLAYPLFELWLWLWLPALNGSIFGRLVLSLPVGLLAMLLVAGALGFLERKAALS